MEGLGSIAVLIGLFLVVIFIIKTVFKVAIRLLLLAVIILLAYLYYTGNLPMSL